MAKRVLIYRLGSLGDTIVALPALHLIERAFPSARRLMLTNLPFHAKAPLAAAILGDSGLVDGYIEYPVGTRSIRELLKLWWRIRSFRPDVLVYLTVPRGAAAVQRDAKFFRLCGIRNIVGLPEGHLAENLLDPTTQLHEQEAARLLRCIAPLGHADLDDLANWDLRLTAEERSAATRELAPIQGRRILACGLGSKRETTDWGTANWRALLDRISPLMPDHALLLVGSKEDIPASDLAAQGWKGPVLNLCGRLTPRQTAAALSSAELFLGPDSGPKFLAGVSGVPCAIAHSARNLPGVWYAPGKSSRNVYHRVECLNCFLDVCVDQQNKCLRSVTVDEMLAAATDAWQAGLRSAGKL
jgi:ADP-heptose:LPS heptosyltransferase